MEDDRIIQTDLSEAKRSRQPYHPPRLIGLGEIQAIIQASKGSAGCDLGGNATNCAS